MRRLTALLIVVGMITAACGTDTGGSGDPLVIYSGRSEDLVAPLIEQFSEETGIEVVVRYDDSTQLATTLLAEGSSTDADVFFAQDPASLGVAAPLLAELDPQTLSMVPDRFSDDNGKWIGTSGRIRVVVYDSETVSDSDLPNNLEDLVDPVWSGRTGVAPTNGSFLAFVAAMILSEGEDYTLDWLERLAANQPTDYPKNSPIVAAADIGEVSIGLVNHYYLLRLRAEGAGNRAANHFLGGSDASSLVMPAGAGIVAGSAQTESAKRFVEFLLSNESQSYFANETFEYPLVPGIAPPAGLPDIDTIGTPDINLSDLADQLERATDLVTEAGLL